MHPVMYIDKPLKKFLDASKVQSLIVCNLTSLMYSVLLGSQTLIGQVVQMIEEAHMFIVSILRIILFLGCPQNKRLFLQVM